MTIAITSNPGDWIAAGILAAAMVIGVLRGALGR